MMNWSKYMLRASQSITGDVQIINILCICHTKKKKEKKEKNFWVTGTASGAKADQELGPG